MTSEVTITERIKDLGLSMSTEQTDGNPNMTADKWAATASHYRCIIRKGKKRLTVHFSQGSAFTEAPTLDSVLDSIVSDSASVDGESFEDWCGTFGADTDSRSAEKTYKACKRTAERLRQLVGDAAYADLLYRTERL